MIKKSGEDLISPLDEWHTSSLYHSELKYGKNIINPFSFYKKAQCVMGLILL